MNKNVLFLMMAFLFAGNVFSQKWNVDWELTKNLALKENKIIVLVFQGSDWCAPCIKLEKEIWSSNEFIEFANKNLILQKADFPRKKK